MSEADASSSSAPARPAGSFAAPPTRRRRHGGSGAASDGREFLEFLASCRPSSRSRGRRPADGGQPRRRGFSSHVSFGEISGSFDVLDSASPEFHRLYANEVYRRRRLRLPPLAVVEQHNEAGPVLIDLDLKCEMASLAQGPGGQQAPSGPHAPAPPRAARMYTRAHVKSFVELYFKHLSRWVDLPESVDGYPMEAYLLEKAEGRISGDYVRDGIHVVLPDVVLENSLQMLVRQDVLGDKDVVSLLLKDMGNVNPVHEIFDLSVLDSSGWMMYGSGKSSSSLYDVTDVLIMTRAPTAGRWIAEEDPAFTQAHSADQILELVDRLSIRSPAAAPLAPLVSREQTVNEFRRGNGRWNRMSRQFPELLQARAGGAAGCGRESDDASPEMLDHCSGLVDILPASMADDRETWLRVGWALHNVSGRLLDVWKRFSAQSAKYSECECEALWSRMTAGTSGVGIGTLKMHAKNHDPAAYATITRGMVTVSLRSYVTCTHYDVASVVAELGEHRFRCAGVSRGTWFEFSGHRWQQCDGGHSLRRLMSTQCHSAVQQELKCQNSRLASVPTDNEAHEKIKANIKILETICSKLKDTNFKDSVMKELREILYDPGMLNKLDSNPRLIGFENGVFDLDEMRFRNGNPRDMLSMSTGYDYVPFDPEDPYVLEMNKFVREVVQDHGTRRYLLASLGSMLDGSVRTERFYIWTGVGSNGKSIFIELVEKAFGDYACKMPVSVLTQKRAAGNAPTAEIARTKGRRFVALQEPGNGEVLNVGLMKELSGGDSIVTRQLYQDPIEFKPQFKLTMICNQKPEIHSDDEGTWRRLKSCPFNSKFLDRPSPGDPTEFKVDRTMDKRLPDMAPRFMSYLLNWAMHNAAYGNPDPLAVVEATRSYRESNDAVQQFIKAATRPSDNPRESVPVKEVYDCWRAFCQDNEIHAKPKRQDFVQAVLRHSSYSCNKNFTAMIGLTLVAQEADGGDQAPGSSRACPAPGQPPPDPSENLLACDGLVRECRDLIVSLREKSSDCRDNRSVELFRQAETAEYEVATLESLVGHLRESIRAGADGGEGGGAGVPEREVRRNRDWLVRKENMIAIRNGTLDNFVAPPGRRARRDPRAAPDAAAADSDFDADDDEAADQEEEAGARAPAPADQEEEDAPAHPPADGRRPPGRRGGAPGSDGRCRRQRDLESAAYRLICRGEPPDQSVPVNYKMFTRAELAYGADKASRVRAIHEYGMTREEARARRAAVKEANEWGGGDDPAPRPGDSGGLNLQDPSVYDTCAIPQTMNSESLLQSLNRTARRLREAAAADACHPAGAGEGGRGAAPPRAREPEPEQQGGATLHRYFSRSSGSRPGDRGACLRADGNPETKLDSILMKESDPMGPTVRKTVERVVRAAGGGVPPGEALAAVRMAIGEFPSKPRPADVEALIGGRVPDSLPLECYSDASDDETRDRAFFDDGARSDFVRKAKKAREADDLGALSKYLRRGRRAAAAAPADPAAPV